MEPKPGHKRERGVNRVVLAVWDLEAGMEFYSAMLSSEFSETTTEMGRSFGVRVAMNFEAGVELVSPLPGAEKSAVRDHLEANGEGVTGVVFAVPDVEASRAAVEALGWKPYFDLDFTQDEIDAMGPSNYSRYKEYFFQGVAPLPGTVLLGEFDSPEKAT